jgi:hypothetical protein
MKHAIECAFLRSGRLFTPDKAAGAAMVIAHQGAGGGRGVLRGRHFLTAAWADDGRFGLRTDVGGLVAHDFRRPKGVAEEKRIVCLESYRASDSVEAPAAAAGIFTGVVPTPRRLLVHCPA